MLIIFCAFYMYLFIKNYLLLSVQSIIGATLKVCGAFRLICAAWGKLS